MSVINFEIWGIKKYASGRKLPKGIFHKNYGNTRKLVKRKVSNKNCMIRSIITQLNKENMVQSFVPQTLVPIYNITFFDRKESYTKKLSKRNSIRTKIVTLDLSPTNSRCSNNVGLFAVSRTFLAHSVMLGGVNASRMVQFKHSPEVLYGKH